MAKANGGRPNQSQGQIYGPWRGADASRRTSSSSPLEAWSPSGSAKGPGVITIPG